MGKENTKHIKLAIASKAAELISQEGIRDYHYAKKRLPNILDLVRKKFCHQIMKLIKNLYFSKIFIKKLIMT